MAPVMDRMDLAKAQSLPVLYSGHTDDLILDTGTHRVWRSRMTVADGMPYDNQITVERMADSGFWQVTDEYDPTTAPVPQIARGEHEVRIHQTTSPHGPIFYSICGCGFYSNPAWDRTDSERAAQMHVHNR